MKNFIKWFGIITIALVIAFSFAACDDGSGGGLLGSGGGDTKITITGIPAGITTASMDIIDEGGSYIGEGTGSVSGTSVTYSLKKRGTFSSWNGRGPYYLHLGLNIWSGGGWYNYTNGSGSEQTYNISSATNTIPFSKFEAQ
jgi:hypothetical protein